jgi:putative hydrolases of HD superfamily
MTLNSEAQSGRAFPPLYKSSGDSASDRLAFFHILERLKVWTIFTSTMS